LLNLDSKQNTIEIDFIAPYYRNADRVHYRYQLVGVTTGWTDAGSSNMIRFTSLPPGHYQFRIESSINNINWFEGTEVLAWSIAFPFWQRWWFVTLVALFFLGFLYYYLMRRIVIAKEKEQVKRQYEKRIAEVEMHALRAQMNPHFMFNSLNSINNFILKNDPDNASGYLTKFSRLMRLILDNSRSEWIVLENELKALELYIQLEVVRFDEVFEYELNIDPGVDVSTTYVPPMIIQPYVENAIWHGLLHRHQPGGKLSIHIWREGELLSIKIEDNGVGRTEAARLKSKSATKHKSHGLKITAERMEIVNRIYNVNAHVDIEDVKGQNGMAGGTRYC
jgi:sensor histidine kinase YesM